MPDSRVPLPDQPLPPNGRCASAPVVLVVDAGHTGANLFFEAQHGVRVARVHGAGKP